MPNASVHIEHLPAAMSKRPCLQFRTPGPGEPRSLAPGRAQRRPRRPWLAALLGVALAVAGIAAAGWHYSDLILRNGPPPTLHEQRVLSTGAGTVTLSRDAQSERPGTWALQWEGGFGTVTGILATDGPSVTRRFERVAGGPPPAWASIRGVSRSADPGSLLGLEYRDVAYPGPLGLYPAWLVPAAGSTWVILVHGRGANRSEGLRTLGALRGRGLPCLLVTYRNDAGAPRSPDGFCHLGLTEWRDLEAAVHFALAHGARDVVLCGYSMGGQLALQFLARSPLAPRVRALVLESPLLDWNATLAARGRTMGVPPLLTRLGREIAVRRARVDWTRLDRTADPLALPVLLFQDAADQTAPAAVAERFVRLHPALVTAVRVQGGDHVETWNVDPIRYAATLGRWLDDRGIGRDTLSPGAGPVSRALPEVP
jgi:uncharacterized protein